MSSGALTTANDLANRRFGASRAGKMDRDKRCARMGPMRPQASRPDALQSVTVLETLEGLAAQHGAAGVPFKELEMATRSRLDYRALTDALNALVTEGAVRRVTEKPARLAITEAGRKRLNEYRS